MSEPPPYPNDAAVHPWRLACAFLAAVVVVLFVQLVACRAEIAALERKINTMEWERSLREQGYDVGD